MRRVILMALAALMANIAIAQEAKHLLEIDATSFRPVQTDALSGVAIDKIELDRSKRPCARIKLHVNRMTPEQINQIQVMPIGGNVIVMKRNLAVEGTGLIIEMTAKQPTRFYLHHDEFGDSNEVSIDLEGNKEYRLDAELRQLYPITVNSNMKDADVYIDNKYCGKTNDQFYLLVHDILPGDHTLRIECAGRRAEQQITVYKESLVFRCDVDTAQARPQYVVFEVVPKNAIVIIDNKSYFTEDGFVQTMLQNGSYTYSVEAKDYHRDSGSFIVSGAKVERKIELQPAFGWLNVGSSSSLNGANIFVDDELIGTAPMRSGQLASGEHRVRIVKPKYKTYEQSVTINDNKVTEFAPTLEADFAVVTITAVDGCEIWINNERKGMSPWREELASGTYIFEARKDGHQTSSITQTISASPHELNYTIEAPKPILGTLNVTSTPAMADVYVDGDKVGRTPLMIEVVIGERNIKLHKDGYGEFALKATINKGEITSVSHKFDSSDVIFNDAKRLYDNKEYQAALPKFKQAADLGHTESNYWLGVMYANGRGVEKNEVEAVRYYRIAAEKGDKAAQNNLGVCYRNGRGVAKNEVEAVKWYRLAANQGNIKAQFNLGLCYEYGRGVTKDINEAKAWYQKAADKGDSQAKERWNKLNGTGTSSSGSSSSYSSNSGGSYIVNEQFSSSSSAWTKTKGQLLYNNGKITFMDQEGSGFSELSYKLPSNLKNQDFQLEFSMRATFRKVYSSIFFILGSSWSNAYWFGLADWNNGKIALSFGDDDKYSKYYNYSTDSNLSISDTHQYRMVKSGSNVKWYTDGKLLCSSTLDMSREINLIGFLVPSKHEIEVDYVTIQSLSSNGGGSSSSYSSSSSSLSEPSIKSTISSNGLSAKEIYEKGQNYNDGKNGVSKSHERAYQYFLKAAEMGYENAYFSVALKYFYGLGTSTNYAEAVVWFKKYYDKHTYSSITAERIGDCYNKGGYGLTANRDEAIRWYRIAADKGRSEATTKLNEMGANTSGGSNSSSSSSSSSESSIKSTISSNGLSAKEIYEKGNNYNEGKNGVSKDVQKAFQYYLKAAEMGHKDAYFKVGLEYVYGPGFEKNYVEAVRWLKINYEANPWSSTSAKLIGECYKDGGYGLTANRDEAIYWLTKAADGGNDSAKKILREMGANRNSGSSSSVQSGLSAEEYYKLGNDYANGKNGKTKSDKRAFEHYMAAAQMGHHESYWKVGLEYRYGPGVEVNYAEAVRWWKKYVEVRSNNHVEKCIGECYRDGGHGLTANRDEAIRWFRKAANGGNEDAAKALREMGAR